MKDFVKEKGIEYLLHFTRLENLNSILENGLIVREELEKSDLDAKFNDDYRYDDCKDALCCSIGHPNYKMFYSLRMENPGVEWCVIAIKKKVLWRKDCAFCIENAASSNVSSIPINERKGIDALKKLYDEIDGRPTRKELAIPSYCPTNPQAEILIFDNIKTRDILGVAFQSQARLKEYKERYDNMQFIYHKGFFYPRVDHRHWS